MENQLPYLSAALLCEKVLIEKDESLSIVRVADKLIYELVGLPPGHMPAATLTGLVSIKSGPVTGDHILKVVGESPSGKRKEIFSSGLKLVGNDQGQNIVLNMVIGISEDGLHWFDILFDDHLLTRIPLTIARRQGESVKPEA